MTIWYSIRFWILFFLLCNSVLICCSVWFVANWVLWEEGELLFVMIHFNALTARCFVREIRWIVKEFLRWFFFPNMIVWIHKYYAAWSQIWCSMNTNMMRHDHKYNAAQIWWLKAYESKVKPKVREIGTQLSLSETQVTFVEKEISWSLCRKRTQFPVEM